MVGGREKEIQDISQRQKITGHAQQHGPLCYTRTQAQAQSAHKARINRQMVSYSISQCQFASSLILCKKKIYIYIWQ